MYFYDEAGEDIIDLTVGTNIDVLVTRDDSTDEFTGYVNGALVLSFIDNSAYAVFGSHGVAHFFVDDDTTEDENSSGFLDSIRIHDTVITPATPVPEPSSLAMFGIGALGLFGYGRRRRQTSAA